MSTKSIYCIPGDCIGKLDDTTHGGEGTYTRNGYIYACLAGTVKINPNSDDNTKTIDVIRGNERLSCVPTIDSIVTCKVLHINANQVRCAIHCVNEYVLRQPFRGVLRKLDIRANDKDKTEIHKCFKPGDIIIAKVFGIAENHVFLLTTASNELGVVVTFSESGVPMVPISWSEMMCPKTFAKEMRKVAKIISEVNINEN